MAVNTTQGIVLAIFGANAGGHLTSLDANATANGNASLATDLSAAAGLILGVDLSSDAAFTSTVLGNLGIAEGTDGYTLASNYFTTNLAAGAGRGDLVAAAVEYLLGSSVDASLTASATAFSTRVTDGVTYSQGDGASVFGVAALQSAAGNAVTAGPGETFELTTSTDTPALTTGNDTITGTTSTLAAADRIVDGQSTDNDVFNLTATADPANMDVTNVENINIDWDAYSTPDVNLTDVSGATVTISSAKAGFLGNVNFTNVGENAIVLGAGMTGAADINGADDTTIDAGSADQVTLGAATADTITLTANSAETITVSGGDDLTIAAAAAETVTFDTADPDSAVMTLGVDVDLTTRGASAEYTVSSSNADGINVNVVAGSAFDLLTVTGDNAVTIDFADTTDADGADVEAGTNGVVYADDLGAATFDISDIVAGSHTFETTTENDAGNDGGTVVISTVNGASIVIEAQDAGENLTFATTAADDGSSDSITVTTESDLAVMKFDTASQDFETVNIVANATTGTGVDVTIDDLVASGAEVIVTSAENEVTISDVEADTLNAQSVAGALSVTQVTGADLEVIAGSAANTVVFAGTSHETFFSSTSDSDESVTFTTDTGTSSATFNGAGTNTVTATAITTGAVTVVDGEGDAVVTATIVGGASTGEGSFILGNGENELTLDLTDNGANAGSAEISAVAGSGDDSVTLTVDADNLGSVAKEVTIDLGTGTNTVDLSGNADGAIMGDITWTVSGVSEYAFGSAFTTNLSDTVIAKELLDEVTTEVSGDGTVADLVTVETLGVETFDASNVTVNQTLTKGLGGLQIIGTTGVQTITGSNGNDSIDGTGGADNLTGGSGNDSFVFSTAAHVNAAAAVDGGAGTDILELDANAITIIDTDLDKFVSVETLTTANGANSITLGANADAAGIKTINGGTGVDTINLSDEAFDNAITITAGAGADVLTLGDAVETVVLGTASTSKDTITGFTEGSGSTADVLDVSADITATSLTTNSMTANTTVADGAIYVVDVNAAITAKAYDAGDFADLFAGSGVAFNTTTTDEEFLIVAQGTDETQIILVDTSADGTAADITAADVEIIGVLSDVINTDTFAIGNFA